MFEGKSYTYLTSGRYVDTLSRDIGHFERAETKTKKQQGTNHADPRGIKTRVLCRIFQQLLQKSLGDTKMDARHKLYYKDDRFTSSEEWWTILRDAYIWFDWFSAPSKRNINVLKSIPAYIERSNFTLILAPGMTHADRIDLDTGRKSNICYRK